MTDAELLAALELDDSYEVLRVLARKPQGDTELVRSLQGRVFVRKRIPRELGNRDAWEALANLRHNQLPRVERIYDLPDQLVVVCEYIEGVSVREMLDRGTPLPVEDALDIAIGLCDAASALHGVGIIHRDISPGNVVIRFAAVAGGLRSRTCLIDLGVARMHDEEARRDTTPLGTWGFAAPEQYGFAQSDARSDVYAIGRLLSCLLRGSMPVEADGLELPEDESLPEPLRAVMERACAFEPSARYQTAADFAASLIGVRSGGASVDSSHKHDVSNDDNGHAWTPEEESVPAESFSMSVADRIRLMRRQPLTWRKVLTQLVLLASGLWVAFIVLADLITWVAPKDNRMLAASFSGPVFALGALVAAWIVLRHYTDNVMRPHSRPLWTLFALLVATVILVLLGLILVVAVAMLALGVQGE